MGGLGGRRAAVAATALAGAGALVALSLLVPSVPTTDPWGWLVWGREVTDLALDTSGGGAPSWKPLPVLLTAPLSLAGDAAPALWLVAARAGALAALVLAFVVGRRLAGAGAGVVAALALAASEDWLRGALHGYTEPAVVALLAGGLELHLRGRHRAALLAIAAAGLARPEVWALLGGYALWLWRTQEGARPLALAVGTLTPLAWLGGDLLGSGDALHGGESARALTQDAGLSGPELVAGAFGGEMLVVVALACAAVYLRRDRLTLALGALGSGWTLFLVLLVALGYPASERFLAPAVAIACVLAGAGAVRLWRWALPRPALRLAGAAALVLAATALTTGRVDRGAELIEAAEARAELQDGLRSAAERFGRRWLLACGPPVLPHDLHWNEGALAWELDVPLRRVRQVPADEVLAGGQAVVLSPRPLRTRPGVPLRVVARSGRWRAYAPEWAPAASARCAGWSRARADARAAGSPALGPRRLRR